MALVPTVRTRLSPASAEEVLRHAWPLALGAEPTAGQLRLALALWDLETGGGQRMFNFNWGNLVEADTSKPHYIANDSGNERRFQSFADALSGASELLRELRRKPAWLAGLLTEHPVRFAEGLKGPPAYYEAPVKRYSRTLTERWLRYRHLAPTRSAVARRTLSVPVLAFVTFGVVGFIIHRRNGLRKR